MLASFFQQRYNEDNEVLSHLGTSLLDFLSCKFPTDFICKIYVMKVQKSGFKKTTYIRSLAAEKFRFFGQQPYVIHPAYIQMF